MTITVTMDQLVNANQALLEVGELTTIPPKASFTIAVVIRKTREEMRTWNEQRQKLIRSILGDKPPKVKPHPHVPGELWVDPSAISMDEVDKLDVAMRELGSASVTIEASKMKLAAFGEKAALKPSWLASLHWLIEE